MNVIQRCPFLSTVPSLYQKLSTKSALVSYAHKCPVLMEAVSRALPDSAAAAKTSPANKGQSQACVFRLQWKRCPHKLYFNSSDLLDPNHRIKHSPNEATDAAGQAVTSRCPFLTAEKNRVVSEASMELQEDVREMDSGCKGEQPFTGHERRSTVKSPFIMVFLLVGEFIEADKPKTGASQLLMDNLHDGDKVQFIKINNFTFLMDF